MTGSVEGRTKNERARVLLFRGLSWCFVGFGALCAGAVTVGLTFSFVEDPSGTAKLWWLFLMLGAISGLMIVIGIKGRKITSVAQLEAQDEAFERRKARFSSWLQGSGN